MAPVVEALALAPLTAALGAALALTTLPDLTAVAVCPDDRLVSRLGAATSPFPPFGGRPRPRVVAVWAGSGFTSGAFLGRPRVVVVVVFFSSVDAGSAFLGGRPRGFTVATACASLGGRPRRFPAGRIASASTAPRPVRRRFGSVSGAVDSSSREARPRFLDGALVSVADTAALGGLPLLLGASAVAAAVVSTALALGRVSLATGASPAFAAAAPLVLAVLRVVLASEASVARVALVCSAVVAFLGGRPRRLGGCEALVS